jgi:MOSC domain-containing protein YiiM
VSAGGSDPSRRTAPRDSVLASLLDAPVRAGTLGWIGVRPARRAGVVELDSADLVAGQGIEGDRYRASGARQVTLIESERVAAIAAYVGAPVHPAQLRRNLMVSGINLLALKGWRFAVGEAELEWSGECHPCSRMEEVLGPGGYNAVRGHGGITARIVVGGRIRLGDPVRRVAKAPG